MAFKHFTNKAFIDMKTGEPRKDLILVEAPLDVEGLVMRGKSSEDEIVFDNQFVNPEQMNFYDLNGKLIKGAQSGLLKEDKKEKELKEYVAESNEYWKKDIERANKNYPNLKIENLPKLVEADKHFGAAAMSFENFKESQLIYLTPQQYLDLTKRFGRTDGNLTEGSKTRIENLEKIISEGGELANIPYLYVKKVGDHYEVSGQEGRHRAQAFKNLSYDKIPVVIQGTGKDKEVGIENKVYTATPKSYLYKEDWAKDYIGFIPNSIQSDGEMVFTKPSDFYDVRTKEKLFQKKEISSNPVGSLIDKPLSNE